MILPEPAGLAIWSWRTPPPAPIDEVDGYELTLDFNLMYSSVARLCGRVKPLLQDLVQEDGCRGAHVERVDPPSERQRHELVAGRRDPWPQAAALRAQHEDDPAGPVHLPVRRPPAR